MKNFTCTLIYFLTFNFVAFGQSNFNIGFKDGFKSGYCYSNQSSYYCQPPLPPLPPLPQISERSNNYQDGYNRGFLYGTAQRRYDDNYSSSQSAGSPNPPKFNPYVPQSHILSLTPAEREAYYAAKARQNQETAEAIGFLLEKIFTVTPQGMARRAERKAKRWEEYKIKHKIKIEKITYTGKQSVCFFSPIFDKPNVDAKQIGTTEKNTTVLILERSQGRFYKVSSSDIIGYISSIWFKNDEN